MIDEITLKTTNTLATKFYERYNSKDKMEDHRLQFMSLLKGKDILDVGCGTGRDCREFSNAGYMVDGIDVSEEMLKYAKIEAPTTKLYLMDMNDFTIDKQYDGIWVCSSLYHIKRKEILNTFKNLNQHIKEDGIIFITVKEGNDEGYKSRKYFGELKKYYVEYQDWELIQLLNIAGFEVFIMTKEYKDQTWINVYAKKQKQYVTL